MDMIVRQATQEDRKQAVEAEGLATPGLHYLDRVYDEWLADSAGELIVAEMDGKVVAVGKFSVVPDGSAWLEALRVRPDRQGLGIGKEFYRRFFTLAQEKGITTMRMYTGVTNQVSKGLAEHFGFTLAGTFRGYTLAVPKQPAEDWEDGFKVVTDGEEACSLLAPHAADWDHFNIMNRTFFKAGPALWKDWSARGFIHSHLESGTVLILGARFIPEQSLHMAMFTGDPQRVRTYALGLARKKGNDRVQCMVPAANTELCKQLKDWDAVPDSGDCIVMESIEGR